MGCSQDLGHHFEPRHVAADAALLDVNLICRHADQIPDLDYTVDAVGILTVPRRVLIPLRCV